MTEAKEERDATPFGLPKRAWASLDATGKIIGLLPIAIGALMYVLAAPDREASFVRESWQALTTRPQVRERYLDEKGQSKERDVPASNWGAKPALEALVQREQKLHSISLNGVDLSEAKLAGGKFAWAAIRGSTFWKADLQDADLQCADLRGTNFRGANLNGAKFGGANISGAIFSGEPEHVPRLKEISKSGM